MALLGEIIDGKYEVLREIGRGGMSVVYLAMDKRLNKQWAIKEFRKDKSDESREMALRALLNEAELMKKLDHPRLPRIVDIIDDNQTVYIIEDYIEGEPLNKVIEEYGAQPQEAVIEWAKQLCEILDYLHTRTPAIIYRDMKPANIVLKPDGSIAVLDFGIAREYKEGKAGDTVNIGTRGYAAPEQFGDRGQTDARTDIYSLGVTLYHLVTGHNPSDPPYEIYPIRHWNPMLSSGLEWVIQKCTQLDPKDRFQSCSEVTYVLENLEKFEETYKSKRRRKITLFFVTAALAVLFSLGGVLGMYLGNKEIEENYESCLAVGTIDAYVQAITIDEDRPDAYVKLAEQLSMDIEVVLQDTDTRGELPDKAIYYQTITVDYFPQVKLEKLKEASLEDYISVNYYLGKLICTNYDAQKPEEKLEKAERYFKNVLNAEKELAEQGGKSPLVDRQYSMAESYYKLSVFNKVASQSKMSADGTYNLPSDVAELLNMERTIEKPFAQFFDLSVELLNKVTADDDTVTQTLRLSTVEILSGIVTPQISSFKSDGVSKEKMTAFFNDMHTALVVLNDPKIDSSKINEVLDTIDLGLENIDAMYQHGNTGGGQE